MVASLISGSYKGSAPSLGCGKVSPSSGLLAVPTFVPASLSETDTVLTSLLSDASSLVIQSQGRDDLKQPQSGLSAPGQHATAGRPVAVGEETTKRRKSFTAEFKLQVVREALERPESNRIKPICRLYTQVTPVRFPCLPRHAYPAPFSLPGIAKAGGEVHPSSSRVGSRRRCSCASGFGRRTCSSKRSLPQGRCPLCDAPW